MGTIETAWFGPWKGLRVLNLGPTLIAALGISVGVVTGGASLYSSLNQSIATLNLRVTDLEHRTDINAAATGTVLDQLTNIRIDVGILKRRSDAKDTGTP